MCKFSRCSLLAYVSRASVQRDHRWCGFLTAAQIYAVCSIRPLKWQKKWLLPITSSRYMWEMKLNSRDVFTIFRSTYGACRPKNEAPAVSGLVVLLSGTLGNVIRLFCESVSSMPKKNGHLCVALYSIVLFWPAAYILLACVYEAHFKRLLKPRFYVVFFELRSRFQSPPLLIFIHVQRPLHSAKWCIHSGGVV